MSPSAMTQNRLYRRRPSGRMLSEGGTLGRERSTFRADQLTVIVMYQPDDSRVEDIQEMDALMRVRPFATLVSAAGLYASHLPPVLKDDGPYGVIECHLAR